MVPMSKLPHNSLWGVGQSSAERDHGHPLDLDLGTTPPWRLNSDGLDIKVFTFWLKVTAQPCDLGQLCLCLSSAGPACPGAQGPVAGLPLRQLKVLIGVPSIHFYSVTITVPTSTGWAPLLVIFPPLSAFRAESSWHGRLVLWFPFPGSCSEPGSWRPRPCTGTPPSLGVIIQD